MASTVVPAPDTPAAAGAARAPAAAPAAPRTEAGTPGPEPTPAQPVTSQETSSSLFSPPNYDLIVGGVAPSPFASILLLGGIVCLVVSAVGTAQGGDMTQWWILGGILSVSAVFLAGFVSRGA